MTNRYPNSSARGSRWDLGRRVWVLIGVIVVLLILLIGALVVVFRSGGSSSSAPASVESSARSSSDTSSSSASSASSPVAIDSLGFEGSHARCDEQDNAVAIGRTASSLVVICQSGPDVSYFYYRGVRLSDNAESEVENAKPSDGGYRALNGETTYFVTRDALTITSGGSTLSNQPMLDYEARPVAVDDGSGAQATSEPTETQRPQSAPQTGSAAYPAAPRSGQGVGEGDFRFTALKTWTLSYEVSCSEFATQGFVDFRTAGGDNLGYVEIYPTSASGVSRAQSTLGPVVAHVRLKPDCTWSLSVVYE